MLSGLIDLTKLVKGSDIDIGKLCLTIKHAILHSARVTAIVSSSFFFIWKLALGRGSLFPMFFSKHVSFKISYSTVGNADIHHANGTVSINLSMFRFSEGGIAIRIPYHFRHFRSFQNKMSKLYQTNTPRVLNVKCNAIGSNKEIPKYCREERQSKTLLYRETKSSPKLIKTSHH